MALLEFAQNQDRAVESGRPGGLRRLARLLAIGAFVAGCGVSPTPSPSANPSGVLFIQPGEMVQAAPPTEELKAVFFATQQLADTNGADLGYAWFDVATGEIVLSAVTPRGRNLIDAAGITAPHRIRTVTHGFDELEHIKDDITFLGAQGVRDAQLRDCPATATLGSTTARAPGAVTRVGEVATERRLSGGWAAHVYARVNRRGRRRLTGVLAGLLSATSLLAMTAGSVSAGCGWPSCNPAQLSKTERARISPPGGVPYDIKVSFTSTASYPVPESSVTFHGSSYAQWLGGTPINANKITLNDHLHVDGIGVYVSIPSSFYGSGQDLNFENSVTNTWHIEHAFGGIKFGCFDCVQAQEDATATFQFGTSFFTWSVHDQALV